MNGPWICLSCRRALRQQACSTRQRRYPQRATYIPFNDSSQSFDTHETDASVVEKLGAAPSRHHRKRRQPGHIPWQFDRTVEEDFVERISENKTRSNGPYSTSKERRGNKNEQATASDAGLTDHDTRPQVYPRVYKRNSSTSQTSRSYQRSLPPLQSRLGFGIPTNDIQDHELFAHPRQYLKPSDAISVSSTNNLARDQEASPRLIQLNNLESDRQLKLSFFQKLFNDTNTAPPLDSLQPPLKDAVQKLGTAYTISMPQQKDVNTADIQDSIFSKPDVKAKDQGGASVHEHTSTILNHPDASHQVAKEVTAASTVKKPSFDPVKQLPDTQRSPSATWEAYLGMREGLRRRLKPRVVNNICQKVVRAWCAQDGGEGILPSPVKVLEAVCEGRSRVLEAVIVRESLWTVLSYALNTSMSALPQSLRSSTELIEQVIAIWTRVLSRLGDCYLRDQQGIIQRLSSSEDWTAFSNSEQMQQMQQWPNKSFKLRLMQFFPENMQDCLRSLDTAALVTWAIREHYIQTNTNNHDDSLSIQAHQISSFFAQIAAQCNIAQHLLQHGKVLSSRCLDHGDSVIVVRKLKSMTGGHEVSATRVEQEVEDHQETPQKESAVENARSVAVSFKRRVGRALADQNVRWLEHLWVEIQKSYHSTSPVNDRERIPLDLYAQVLTAFMALRRPSRAIEAWNHMTTSGLQPGIQHWDAMLKGCGYARDPEAIDQMWDSMIQAGYIPDAHLWATRIHALGTSGRIEDAIRSFQLMAKEWIEATAPQNRARASTEEFKSNVAKPNIQCLNALVGVLARANRHEQLVEALSWRKTLDIQSDSYTYNALIKSALRDQDLELASKLIQQMNAQGVKPDIATFTMMLDSAFQQQNNGEDDQGRIPITNVSTVNENDPFAIEEAGGTCRTVNLPTATASQQSAIDMIFGHLHRQSIKPTAHTFSTLVVGLLRSAPPNAAAAYGVLQHLVTHSLPLSAQIYSSLISYHFSQYPPDLQAVDALWYHAREQRKNDSHLILDAIFYDRFIEGWAVNGQVRRALQARRVARGRGKAPSWQTLRILVEALIRCGDWRGAEQVVLETKREEEAAGDDGRHSRKGSSAFWGVVRANGLDSSYDVTSGA